VSTRRFTLLVALLCLVVAAASFAAVTAALDDDPADPAASETTTTAAADDTTTSTTPVDDDGVLDTPSFVVIVASEGDEAAAEVAAREIQEAGYPSGFLLSDDFPSLTPGFWVAFAGPYPDAPAANAQIEPLADDGFPGAYVRCVGTTEECA
jgi:hypothetical protein